MLLVRENYLGLHPSTFGMAVLIHVSLITPRRVLDAREEATCPCLQLPVSLAVVLAALPLPWVLKVSDIQCLVLQTGLISRLINAEHSRTNISHTESLLKIFARC